MKLALGQQRTTCLSREVGCENCRRNCPGKAENKELFLQFLCHF
jgi:flavoprotein